MENHVAVVDKVKTRKPRRTRPRIILNYEPIGVIVEIQGAEIRKKRHKAGLHNQSDFAGKCGWSPTLQSGYEADGRHEMSLEKVNKMARVCNGEE